MCGIAGIYSAEGSRQVNLIGEMSRRLAHRGPDGDGLWFSVDRRLALAHRRLAILDLSPAGSQPMHTLDRRFTIVFNGEVFNFSDIRRELEVLGVAFRSTSDTEVVLYAIAHWGLENALERFVGMFAFAIWDEFTRTLSIVRDRIGIKPLYYGWANDGFWFASELKAIPPLGDFEVNREVMKEFFQYGYISGPDSIFSGVYKLLPGTFFTFSESALASKPVHFSPHPDDFENRTRPKRYWSFLQSIFEAQWESHTLPGSENDLLNFVEEKLSDAIGLRMVADVPIGAFLSGGIDSSLVTALMQRQTATPVNTFTIGFQESEFDETSYARKVAKHLGTNHHEEILTAKDCLDIVPSLSNIYDEPFADSSQIPTLLISRIARRSVTVALSGDGGDELFCGYTRYRIGQQLSRLFNSPLRKLFPAIAPLIDRLAQWAPEAAGYFCERFGIKRGFLLNRNLRRMSYLLSSRSEAELYARIVSQWEGPCSFSDFSASPKCVSRMQGLFVEEMPFTERMMVFDSLTYLPDDILVKLDRASMFSGLEARVPLLDHRMVSLAWRLPIARKLGGVDSGKLILRQILSRHIPENLVNRPKMGFSIPIEDWLRGPLREWASGLINSSRVQDLGLDPQVIRKGWNSFTAGTQQSPYGWWAVLMFISWHNHWLEQSRLPFQDLDSANG